ncbi:chemotaxis protein MotB [Virgibacillus natechei]|uniref:Chemotaxis protein MotB n=1 Tax=Virgibacillus natechei TaxID=1216297 RepID=A0ABS4IJR2_9BACI|nr:flagellar motor protein MotB [Virgibacillus natechei]MBP1971212.1 chemotaxis protein MotB [Virgibacillus natechei]UZD11960.1 flagellar motor protein MotB [Virgibacillus natechei]
MSRRPMRRNRRRKDRHIDESWLLPYSDLLTLLVALFIVLFAMSDVDAQRYQELAEVFQSEFSSAGTGIVEYDQVPVEIPVESNEEDEVEEDESEEEEEIEDQRDTALELLQLQDLQEEIDHYIEENNLAEELGTALTDEGLLISIENEITFESASAVVNREGEEIAHEIADLLHTDPPRQIVISGHADDRPMNNEEFESNWELSVQRAVNFMGIILENDELDPARYSAKGYGEHQPILPNTSEENRALNRRVEVLVLPNFEIQTELDDLEDQ